MLEEPKVKSDNGRGVPGRGGGWGRVVLSRNINKSIEPKTVEVTPPTSDNKRDTNCNNGTNTSVSTSDAGNRCNGRLQRTKRIDDGDAGDDRDSIASVTIISVPSSMVTPMTSSGNWGNVNVKNNILLTLN